MLERIMESTVLLALCIVGIARGLAYDLGKEWVTFRLLGRGLERVTLPTNRARLIHAVVICEYKEPYGAKPTEAAPLLPSSRSSVRTVNWGPASYSKHPSHSDGERTGTLDWITTHTEFGKGRFTLPKQVAGHKYLKYLI